MATEFAGLRLTCNPHEYITIPMEGGLMNYCPITAGDTLLDTIFVMPKGEDRFNWNAGMVTVVMIIVRAVAYAALRWSAWRHLTKSEM